jgi:hypothetical protein
VLSLSTLPTPTPLDDLKECNEYPWKFEYDQESNEYDQESNEYDY